MTKSLPSARPAAPPRTFAPSPASNRSKALKDEMILRHSRFVSGPADAYLFFSDCNETNSGINEPVTLAESKDFGQDKLTALSLLQRHKHLQDKTQSIEGDVHELKRTDETLRSARRRCT